MKEEPNSFQTQESKKSNGYYLTYKYLIAASLAALMISTFASWFFYSRWNEAEDRYTAQLTDLNQISQTYNLLKTSLDQAVADLSHIRDENSECIQLYGTDTTQLTNVRVFWNAKAKDTFVHVILLANPLPGYVYHLWAKNGKEAPVDCGIVDFASISMQHMISPQNATAWAVSVESTGVSPVMPSGEITAKSKEW